MNTVRAAQSAEKLPTSEPVSEVLPVRSRAEERAPMRDRDSNDDLYDNIPFTD